MCGAGSFGQLGIGYYPQKEYKPVKVTIDEKIIQVSCGDVHSAFLTETGEVLMTGDNSFWQLGNSSNSLKNTAKPLSLHSLIDIPIKQL
jgi:alpha-tubulin suppressor-like RCC1 family protein